MLRDNIAYSYLDQAVPLIDAILHRGRSTGVEAGIIHGEVIYTEWRIYQSG